MPNQPPSAIVLIAKSIHTMDPLKPRARAVVVRGAHIAFVGEESEALSFAGEGAAVERWPRSTIVPGLIDSHGHLASLGRTLTLTSLEAATSERVAVDRLRAAGAPSRQGGWVLGHGWDHNDWDAKEFPTRATLDAAFPHDPVFLTRIDGHAAWVNGAALRRARVDRLTADPEGGRIHRDARGEPTGVLIDNAIELVSAHLPNPTEEELRTRLKRAVEACLRFGLTQVHDAGTESAAFELLQQWDLLGLLPLRVYAMAEGQGSHAGQALDLGPFRGRHLERRAAKLLADGALGSRGAALHEPYSDEPTHRGLLLLAPSALAERAEAFASRGFQVAIHAIGDRANTLALDTLLALESTHPGQRPRLEHAQVLAPADVSRLARSNVVASFQPSHATSDMPWAAARLGGNRLAGAYAWKSVQALGGHLALGSDFPVEDPNPLWGIYAARTRQDRSGEPRGGWFPEQRLSGAEALHGYTVGGAWASFSESHRGMLREGYDADLVILPVDPVEDAPSVLLQARVQLTMVGGVDVYREQ